MKQTAILSRPVCIRQHQHQHQYRQTWFRIALLALSVLVLSVGTIFAQTANCTAKPITPEKIVEEALSSTDCKSPFQNNPADRYLFDGAAGQKVAIQLTSTNLDTYLYLIGPDGAVKAENDNGGGGQNARIVLQLPLTGAYIIEATARGSQTTGAYKLLLSIGGNACIYSATLDPAEPFRAFGGVGGVNIASNPGCSWKFASNVSWIKLASASATGTGNGTVYFRLDPNDSGSARNGSITTVGQTLPIVQFGNPMACPRAPINAGQTISGTLGQGDCASAFRTGALSDRYYFNVTGGQKIAITVLSSSFDAYVCFIGPDGSLLKDSDSGGGDNNARLPATDFHSIIASGTYFIEVTSAIVGQSGSYKLSLEVIGGGCGFNLNKRSQIVAAADGVGSAEIISTGTGCSWHAISGSSWITILSSSGAGSGAIRFTAEFNTNQSPRMGTILVGGKTLAVAQLGGNPTGTVSAASFSNKQLAADSIVSSFGVGLATDVKSAETRPLPISLAGTRVKILDSENNARDAGLFFVSPGQVNLLIPPATASGEAMVTIIGSNGDTSSGILRIAKVAPGLFTADSSGQGRPTGYVLRYKADGTQEEDTLSEFNAELNQFVTKPIDLGQETDQVFLVLFGTGFRNRTNLAAVSAKLGGVKANVTYAGSQGNLIGVDQLNLLLPRTLAGRGEVELTLTVDDAAANVVKVSFK
ncbi:MAG: pre-peptidase C-terminal domain-containing protein [Acidobacteriota bacterium]